MIYFWVGLILFISAFTQSVTGFGFALVSMPLLVSLISPIPAAALVSISGFTVQLTMMSRYRRSIKVGYLWRIMLGAVVGIPIGVWLLVRLDEHIILTVLGVFLIFYVLYSFFSPHIPTVKNNRWDFPVGLFSGTLSGAFNTGGPPYVVYSVASDWQPTEHKANMQALLTVNTTAAIAMRFLYGHYTVNVMQMFMVAVPAVLLGTFIGFYMDRFISAAQFRKIVLVMLLIIGLRMLFG